MKVIRTLWGAEGEGSRWSKVWKRNVQPMLQQPWTIEQTVLVYGAENYKRLKASKNPLCRPVLLDSDPWGGMSADYFSEKCDTHIRPWILKWRAIELARQELGDLVYCDWDVRCGLRPEYIADAYEMLVGRELALSGYMYRRTRHPSREGKRAQRFSVSGNCLFLAKNSDWAGIVLKRMVEEGKWDWHDEIAMGDLLDEMYEGKWMGDAEWLERFEFPLMIQSPRRAPWNHVQHPDRSVIADTPIPFEWRKFFWQ